MDASDSPSSCLWRGCGVLLLLGLVGAVVLLAELRAQAVDREARAPVVIAGAVQSCQLSPSG